MNGSTKIVLITGAAQGIGKAIAQRYLREDMHIVVFDVAQPDYECTFYRVDVRDEQQIIEAFKNIEKVDVLVNNAGVYFHSLVEDTQKDELDRIIDINIKGTYLVAKHALPLLRKSSGNMVNVSSVLALVPEPESPAYCATKSAINMLTKSMAQQYASEGIRINAVLPGPIDTPLLRASFSSEEAMIISREKNPMKRIGAPEEVANAVFFLSSVEASYITGAMLSVDGGESSSSVYSK